MSTTETPLWSERLDEFFNGVVVDGCGVALPTNLLLWTRRKRVTASFWALLKAACDRALINSGQQDAGYRLHVGDGSEAYTFVIWDGGDASTGGWWQSIDTLMQKKKRSRPMQEGDEDQEDDDAAV